MNLLHIDSSILGAHSVSRTLSAAVVERLQKTVPDLHVTTRDLAAMPLDHMSGLSLAGRNPEAQHDEATRAELAVGEAILAEFIGADIVVIGVALYNFTISSQLKAWIDRIVAPGKTFRYTEKGPEGLMGGKRLILAVARGGVYAPGTPYAPFEHAESYLRAMFGFMGITQPEVIIAEGLSMGPEHKEAAVKAALADIEARIAA